MKGKKYIVPLLLAGVTATGYVTNITQNVSVNAAAEEITNIVGEEIKLEPFAKDTYEIGQKVYLPVPEGITLSGAETDAVEYVITKGGKTITISGGHENFEENVDVDGDGVVDGNRYFFTADYWGYYNIQVSIKSENKVVSKIDNLSVFVTQNDAVINLPVNSSRVIPAKIATNQANFEIPAPTVTVDDEKLTALELGTQLEVRLFGPADEAGKVLTLDNQGTKDFYKVDSTLLSTPGTYQIVYTYKTTDGKYVTSLDTNFQVVKNYDPSKIKLTMTFLDDVPSTGNVNTDISVPKVKVTESASSLDAINAEVIVKVTNVKKPTQTIEFNYEDFTFKPTEPGYYSVTYQAKIGLFGLSTKEITPDTIIEVEDNIAPVVRPTYAYTMENGEIKSVNGATVSAEEGKTAREVAEELLVSREVDIPAVAIKGETFKIPAAYATDNYFVYKGGDSKDITIKRSYKDGSAVSEVKNVSANEEAEIKFNETGKAEIRYYAEDQEGNTLGDVTYTVQVYDSLQDLKDGETKVNINVGTDVVTYREETLSFSKPTAKDTYDDKVEVRTFYVVTLKNGGDQAKKELTELTKDGKYEISIKDDILSYETATDEVVGIKVFAEAYVDQTLVGNYRANGQLATDNKVVSDVQEITFVGKNFDKEKPDIAMASAGDWNAQLLSKNTTSLAKIPGEIEIQGIDEGGNALNSSAKIPVGESTTLFYAPFDQGDTEVTLPDVKFFDSDEHLSTSVTVQNINGTTVSDVSIIMPSDAQTNKPIKVTGGYEYVVSGLKVKLSYAGLYVVTYRAEDIAGNVTVQSFGFKANDKTAPSIIIEDEDEFGKDIEVGEYFKVPTPTLVKDGQVITGGDKGWEIYKTSGTAKYKESANGFTPLSEGTFFIRYFGTDESLNDAKLEDSSFVITAKDTQAPEIKLINGNVPATKVWNPATNETSVDVSIPVAYGSDILTKKDVEVVCTVTTPSGTKITPEVSKNDATKLTFKATSEGVYTVKYYATDDAGNEKTITKTISVGDCVKPQLVWKEELETTATLGSDFVLDMNQFSLDDFGVTDEETLRKKLDVTMTGPDNTKLTNLLDPDTGYKWKLDSTGKYTLKFTLKDKAGNANTYTYSITVPEEEVEKETVSPAVGIVLVVLSVVVLSGVVVYFVVSSKKKSVKTSKKSK